LKSQQMNNKLALKASNHQNLQTNKHNICKTLEYKVQIYIDITGQIVLQWKANKML
jgi:hypothetical protein